MNTYQILISILYKIITIFGVFMLLFSVVHSENYLEQFTYSQEFYEKPLILDYNEGISGIITISPLKNAFSEYSWIKLSKSIKTINNEEEWLYERLFAEIQNLATVERALRSEDSPLLETIFDTARTSLPDIDDTLKKAAINPEFFCELPKLGYNKQGVFTQLYCKYPLGMFKYYLILRLQKINNTQYFLCISALNNKRLRELLEIANTIELIKSN